MKQEEKRNREKKITKKGALIEKKSTGWKVQLPTFNCWKLKKHLIFKNKRFKHYFDVWIGKYT